jgi:hypothetical protein
MLLLTLQLKLAPPDFRRVELRHLARPRRVRHALDSPPLIADLRAIPRDRLPAPVAAPKVNILRTRKKFPQHLHRFPGKLRFARRRGDMMKMNLRPENAVLARPLLDRRAQKIVERDALGQGPLALIHPAALRQKISRGRPACAVASSPSQSK